jgi:hypothetical protein
MDKDSWVLAIVETETHLVQVGLQMLCTGTMARSNDAALQGREWVFAHGRVLMQSAQRSTSRVKPQIPRRPEGLLGMTNRKGRRVGTSEQAAEKVGTGHCAAG